MNAGTIQSMIHEVRGCKVMLDYDLAVLYGLETKVLNQAVKRNLARFPADFMFRLSTTEWSYMRSQFVTASQKKRNTSVNPFAFTEHGVTMLASILKTEKAIKTNIVIVRAFISLRQIAIYNKELADRIAALKENIYGRLGEHDSQLAAIYEAIESLLDKQSDKQNWDDSERIGFKTAEGEV